MGAHKYLGTHEKIIGANPPNISLHINSHSTTPQKSLNIVSWAFVSHFLCLSESKSFGVALLGIPCSRIGDNYNFLTPDVDLLSLPYICLFIKYQFFWLTLQPFHHDCSERIFSERLISSVELSSGYPLTKKVLKLLTFKEVDLLLIKGFQEIKLNI